MGPVAFAAIDFACVQSLLRRVSRKLALQKSPLALCLLDLRCITDHDVLCCVQHGEAPGRRTRINWGQFARGHMGRMHGSTMVCALLP